MDARLHFRIIQSFVLTLCIDSASESYRFLSYMKNEKICSASLVTGERVLQLPCPKGFFTFAFPMPFVTRAAFDEEKRRVTSCMPNARLSKDKFRAIQFVEALQNGRIFTILAKTRGSKHFDVSFFCRIGTCLYIESFSSKIQFTNVINGRWSTRKTRYSTLKQNRFFNMSVRFDAKEYKIYINNDEFYTHPAPTANTKIEHITIGHVIAIKSIIQS